MDKKDILNYYEMSGDIESSGAMNELLSTLPFQQCITDNLDTKTTTYRIYFDNEPEREELISRLSKSLEEWQEMGISCSAPNIGSIKNEDWTEVWKRYFKIQKINSDLVVKATWLEYEQEGNETIIEIDPGMSFGTGSHETTQFCLKAIHTLSGKGYKTFLDAGCGSGILAITAAKLGFEKVFAFDYDQESVNSSLENFKLNKVENYIQLSNSDIKDYKVTEGFDVVVANIISGILLENVERLKSWITHDGYLILAGILKSEYPKVRDAFVSEGLLEISSDTEKEWTGGIFTIAKKS